MNPTAIAKWLQRRDVHYGWVVTGITFLTMFTMSAALSLPGAMLLPLSKEFGWSTDQISGALALRFALFGLAGPFTAVLIERWGLRAVMALGLSLVGVGMALVTVASALWHLFVLWSLLLGLGTGLTALVLGAVVASRWFAARRGLVIGLLTASAATGQLAYLPFAAWMIESWGWRSAIAPVFLASVVVGVLALLLIRNRPADVGLAPYGEVLNSTSKPLPPNVPMNFATPFRVLAEASHNPTFWILFATFFICGLSTNGLMQTHFIALCADNGIGAVPAASVLAMMGIFDFFGTVLSGWLSDRYDCRRLLFWYYGLRGLSLLLLPYSEFTLYGLGLFAIFYGLDWIATVPPTVKLAGATWGPQKVGLVFGWVFAGHQLGAAFAAWGAGLVRALWLSYNPALYAAGAACAFAAVLILLAGRSRPVIQQQDHAIPRTSDRSLDTRRHL